MMSTQDALSRVPGELFALLLIFFIVASAVRVEGYAVELDLVDAGNGAKIVRPENPHHLAVFPDGSITLDGVAVSVEDVEARLAADSRPVQFHVTFSPSVADVLSELQRLQVPVLLAVDSAAQTTEVSK
jgi:hypothetical protein